MFYDLTRTSPPREYSSSGSGCSLEEELPYCSRDPAQRIKCWGLKCESFLMPGSVRLPSLNKSLNKMVHSDGE